MEKLYVGFEMDNKWTDPPMVIMYLAFGGIPGMIYTTYRTKKPTSRTVHPLHERRESHSPLEALQLGHALARSAHEQPVPGPAAEQPPAHWRPTILFRIRQLDGAVVLAALRGTAAA